MKPILFAKTATQFNTNGIGRLDCVECLVIEERNGQYELEMTISQESQYASDIGMESIIVVKPNDSDPLQAFRVYQITKPIGGLFEVFANHIRYQLNYIPTMPFSVSASTSACAQTLAGLKNNAVSNCPFIFHTDVQTVASYNQNLPASIGTMMGGTAGSVIDQFGGEWKYDNYDVYLYNHRGVQNPTVTFRYGKDITDLKQEEEIANTITGIVPFWTDAEGGELVTLPEKVVESPNASNFTFTRIVTIDFSSDFENKPTQNALRTHAQAYINKAGIGIPKVSIDVSFIDLAKTMEYEDLLQFQSVNLCDIVGISFEKLGIETTAKIVKVVYNVLKERYESIEIGAVRSSVAHTLNDTNASVMALADTTKTNFAKASNETDDKIADAMDDVQTAIDNATAWLTQTGGVIRALKNSDGEWTDILCMSATATATTGNVLRFNVNGIGFSSTGWNGDFKQAWTIDGKLIIGGTNVPSITVYDNYNNIIFQADATKFIWNSTYSSMSETGVITATGAQLSDANITNGAITMVGSNSWLKLKNGVIYGGRGTTVGQNQTYIGFNHLVDGYSENIEVNANYAVMSNNGIVVKRNRNDVTGFKGSNKQVAVPLVDFQFVQSPTDLYIGDGNPSGEYQTIPYNFTYDSSTGKFSWNTFDLRLPPTWDINGDYYTLNQGAQEVIHGLVTDNSAPVSSSRTIHFDANGGTGSVPPDMVFANTSSTSDTTGTYPSKSGYTFYGWSATPEWSQKKRVAYTQESGGATAPDGTTARITGSWTFSQWRGRTGAPSGVMEFTLYAQWYAGSNGDDVIIEEG